MRTFILFLSLFLCSVTSAEDSFAQAFFPKSLLKKYNKPRIMFSEDIHQVELKPLPSSERKALIKQFSVSDGLQPEVIAQRPPIHPYDQKVLNNDGSVIAYLVVSKEGFVSEVYLYKYSHPSFAKSAAFSLKFWQFKPSPRDQLVAIPLQFTLNEIGHD